MTNGTGTRDPHDPPDIVERLLEVSGARREPPRADYEHVLTAATAALERKRRQLRWRSGARWVGLAATLSGVAVVVWTMWSPVAPAAIPKRIIGDVELLRHGADGWEVMSQQIEVVSAGDTLRTAHGARAALTFGGGGSLRLDEGTELVLVSPARAELRRGAVYVDSGGMGRAEPMEIVTPLGTARDVGTQFQVRFAGDALRVWVREGVVALRFRGNEQHIAGEQLTLRASGDMERHPVRRDDPAWRWTESVAVAPPGDHRPLGDVLVWVARETGRDIRYSSPEIERRANAVVLHGSMGELSPLDLLDAALATADLAYTLTADGSILIGPR